MSSDNRNAAVDSLESECVESFGITVSELLAMDRNHSLSKMLDHQVNEVMQRFAGLPVDGFAHEAAKLQGRLLNIVSLIDMLDEAEQLKLT